MRPWPSLPPCSHITTVPFPSIPVQRRATCLKCNIIGLLFGILCSRNTELGEKSMKSSEIIKILLLSQTKGESQLSNRLHSVESIEDTDNSGMCT